MEAWRPGEGCLGTIHLQPFAFQKLEKLMWIMQWVKGQGERGVGTHTEEPVECPSQGDLQPHPKEVMGPPPSGMAT